MNRETSKLKDIFKRNAEKIFVSDSITRKEFTYGNIENLSLKLALILDQRGINKGDKIAIILPNCMEHIVIYFACMQIGAIPVPINMRLHPKEIDFLLTDSESKMLFLESSLKEKFEPVIKEMKEIPLYTICPTRKDKKGRISNKDFDFFQELEKQDKYKEESFQNINDDDIIIIAYTSGTTKQPKGVMLSYGNLIRNGLTFKETLGLGSDMRFYNYLALSYLGGFYNLMLIPFLSEASIVLDDVFGPKLMINFWEKVKRHNINALWLVPSIISIILSLDHSDIGINYCKNNIKIALVGTAPLNCSLKKMFEEKYSLTLYENYGLSETTFISTNSPDFHYNKGVGKVIPGCEFSIIDEKGGRVNNGEKGEIIVKSTYIMKGYHKNEEETMKSLKNGKFYTGDIGYVDEGGYLFITDRKKDMIISGGINISPREIEEAIMSIRAVEEAAVMGMPHDLMGEEIVAIVVKSGDGLREEEIKKHCRENIASFKVPGKVVFVDELPRSVTGKIQKHRLKRLEALFERK